LEHGRGDLQKLFAETLKNASDDQAPLLAWPLVCGPGVSNRTRPMDFVRGVLRVQVPDKEWKAQLESLVPDYLRAFATLVEKKKVERIEFVVPNLRKMEPLGREK
jgi:hypothetical protein